VLRKTTSRGLGQSGLVCPSRTKHNQALLVLPPRTGPGVQRLYTKPRAILQESYVRGEGDSGGHVLQETTSQGLRLCGLVCPS